jgi:hypothetical protein
MPLAVETEGAADLALMRRSVEGLSKTLSRRCQSESPCVLTRERRRRKPTRAAVVSIEMRDEASALAMWINCHTTPEGVVVEKTVLIAAWRL